MRKAYILLVFGVWVAVLPHLGLPYFWKDILITLSGLGLVGFSYMMYRESKIKEIGGEKTFDNFSENNFEPKEERGEAQQ